MISSLGVCTSLLVSTQMGKYSSSSKLPAVSSVYHTQKRIPISGYSFTSCAMHQETGDINPTGIIYEEKAAAPPVSIYIIYTCFVRYHNCNYADDEVSCFQGWKIHEREPSYLSIKVSLLWGGG